MTSGDAISLASVQGSEHGDGGVASGALLTKFVEAGLAGEPTELAEVRTQVAAELGDAVVADASGVMAIFQLMNRIANGTGTPLDAPLVAQTQGVREQIDFSGYASYAELP